MNHESADERSLRSPDAASTEPAPPSASRRDRLVFALARGDRQVQAASYADVSNRTVRRYLADPEFARRVSAARAEIHDAAMGRLVDATSHAVDVATELMNSPSNDTTRLRAAHGVLKLASDHMNAKEVAAGMEKLELKLADITARFDETQR